MIIFKTNNYSYIRFLKRTLLVQTRRNVWKSVIGLEVHAQIQSSSKLFSGSSTAFENQINSNVSLFDCATPGTLPVLNRKCVEAAALTALALNCHISPISAFDRKHYFYSDLPAGYQITQQRAPLASNGYLQFEVQDPNSNKKWYSSKSHIKQIQLEQDSGRSIHEDKHSLIDLNRAGIPLMELVFEPDLSTGEEAAALIKELCLILETLGTCSCKMEEGALRVDANVSVHRENEPLGVRTEIKNIGSIRGVANAITYEIQRQINLLKKKHLIVNETRAWDAFSKVTVPMRDKEEKQDYCYMPEPNLPLLRIGMGFSTTGCVNIDDLLKNIPELPSAVRNQLKSDYGLTAEQAIIIVSEPILLKTFKDTISKNCASPKIIANLLINDLLKLLNEKNISLKDCLLNFKFFIESVKLLEMGVINRQAFQFLLKEMLENTSKSAIEIVNFHKLKQISDTSELKKICQEIIDSNPNIIMQYKSGKTKVFNSLLGQIVTKTDKRANMQKASKMLEQLLKAK